MMKKVVKILCFALIFALCIPYSAFARTFKSDRFGIIFNLDDAWVNINPDEGSVFARSDSSNEGIVIERVTLPDKYSLDEFEDGDLINLCDSFFSNNSLADRLSEANKNANVTVTEDSVVTGYENHNSVKYFRYEKLYTAHAYGYLDTTFYDTSYLTFRGGDLYAFSYSRDQNNNHFAEFVDMLDSIQYSDVIGIKVNGERIYPDSDPVLVSDRTLVPIRAIAEKLGYSVEWDPEYLIITMLSDDQETILHFGIGESYALKNFTEEIPLDVPATIIGSRTYLPLRAVAEAMDADVNWNATEKTVEIRK